MNIHEYQAKEILRKFGINVPIGVFVSILNELDSLFCSWHISKPANARGLSVEALSNNLKKRHINDVHSYATVTSAYHGALNLAQRGESVVVFGSAFTVAEVLSLHV